MFGGICFAGYVWFNETRAEDQREYNQAIGKRLRELSRELSSVDRELGHQVADIESLKHRVHRVEKTNGALAEMVFDLLESDVSSEEV